MDWSVVDSNNVEGDPILTLELKDAPYSRSMWDFSFRALYKVSSEYKVILIGNGGLIFTFVAPPTRQQHMYLQNFEVNSYCTEFFFSLNSSTFNFLHNAAHYV